MYVVKTKVLISCAVTAQLICGLISCAVTAQLICGFVFTYAKLNLVLKNIILRFQLEQ